MVISMERQKNNNSEYKAWTYVYYLSIKITVCYSSSAALNVKNSLLTILRMAVILLGWYKSRLQNVQHSTFKIFLTFSQNVSFV